ncbi:hypothetical protein JCM21900_001423 [Sporobolomyces salmonicolor]
MPIKLLQHKSWHVYSQENIARVKRDEALAAAQEDAEDQRTLLADSEARLDRMRRKADKKRRRDRDDEGEKALDRQLKGKDKERERDEDGEEVRVRAEVVKPEGSAKGKERDDSGHSMMTGGHVNFWAELEAGRSSYFSPDGLEVLTKLFQQSGQPSQAKLEARLKKVVEQEPDDSLTKVYLAKKGEGEPKGWYATEDGKTERERKEGVEATLERAYRDNETKRMTDPLALMNSYLQRRSDILSGKPIASARPPSSRDRYITPSSSSYADTPRSSSSRLTTTREDDLEPVVTSLLGPKRRRGDPFPPPSAPPAASSSSSRSPASTPSSKLLDPHAEAATRVSAERARAAALLAQRRRAAMSSAASSVASATPRSEWGAQEGGYGMFNREEARAARERRGGGAGGGGGGWGEQKRRRGERERGGWERDGRRW